MLLSPILPSSSHKNYASSYEHSVIFLAQRSQSSIFLSQHNPRHKRHIHSQLYHSNTASCTPLAMIKHPDQRNRFYLDYNFRLQTFIVGSDRSRHSRGSWSHHTPSQNQKEEVHAGLLAYFLACFSSLTQFRPWPKNGTVPPLACSQVNLI